MNYASLKQSHEPLNAFLREIEAVTQEEYDHWSRDEKLAFWINAYNALAIKMVIDHYPLKKGLSWQALIFPENSIQQIPNVWDKKFLNVLGKKISLNFIENEILRKEFAEPRIHFALVCASLGCPELREEPYLAEKLDWQLENQTQRFLQDPNKFRYDAKSDALYLSPIFKWFKKDFEKSLGIISFVKAHLSDPKGKEISSGTKIEWLGYDWNLNHGGEAS